MIDFLRRTTVAGVIAIGAAVALAGCATQTPSDTSATPTPSATPTVTPSQSPSTANSITLSDTRHGFTFTLPLSWAGYKIVDTKWQGVSIATGAQVETGPQISIRHPLWTSANKRQDIPIMIFMISQWNDLIAEKFHIGAAPIPPSELGRNAAYVFALPARYNYAFPTGYQEVEQILRGNPLHPNGNYLKLVA